VINGKRPETQKGSSRCATPTTKPTEVTNGRAWGVVKCTDIAAHVLPSSAGMVGTISCVFLVWLLLKKAEKKQESEEVRVDMQGTPHGVRNDSRINRLKPLLVQSTTPAYTHGEEVVCWVFCVFLCSLFFLLAGPLP
jgi:hypothetical protein